MIKLLADENFDNTIVRGLFRRNSALDIVRVQDVGLSGEDDPTVLEWAAQEGRVLLTHDVATITRYAYDRVRQGQAMPGVIEIRTDALIGQVIEDVLILVECSQEGELESQVQYLPVVNQSNKSLQRRIEMVGGVQKLLNAAELNRVRFVHLK